MTSAVSVSLSCFKDELLSVRVIRMYQAVAHELRDKFITWTKLGVTGQSVKQVTASK